MGKDSGLLDTSSFGTGAKPGPDNLNRPGRDAMSGRGAPKLGPLGAQPGEDFMRRTGSARTELERNTHPERQPVSPAPDSGVEGSEHLGSGAQSERDERE